MDEGQNLPGEMLDVFRTLLNFETDDFKLLQLIIFGQPEMGKIIKNIRILKIELFLILN